MPHMEELQPANSELSTGWRARLLPLQGPCVAADILVTNMASRLMTVRSATPVAPGIPVRVDQHDAILLGEVIACRQESPGEYALLIEMNESLSGLHSLRKLVTALLGEARDGEPAHPLPQAGKRRRELGRRTGS